MFIKKLFFLICLGLFMPLFCLASFNLSDWKYFKEIDFSQDGLINFDLGPEVFFASQKDLADLRVADQKGEEVPYYLEVSQDNKSVEAYSPRLLNNTFVKGKYSSIILDTGEEERIINRLKIITDSENFQRNVSLQGSSDGNNWQTLLGDAYIYNYTDEKGDWEARDTQLEFTDSTFRYYKVEIDDPEGEPVKIKDAEVSYYKEEKEKKKEFSPDYEVSENEEEKETEILLDLGGSGMLINEIELGFVQDNFHRGVYIYASDDKDDWDYQGSAYIFDYQTSGFQGKNLRINFSGTKKPYLKAVIDNKDNSSLDLNKLKAYSPVHRLYFRADPGKSYRLYYGNPRAEKVEYDLEKYFSYLDKDEFVGAGLSGQKENPSFTPPPPEKTPLTERIPYLLPVSLLILCVFLLFLVFKFLKK